MAYQALAAVLGGCQSLHTNSMDETLALPSEHAVTLALRTQQVLAYETGVTNTVDPLGGSYFVEALTRSLCDDARSYFDRIESCGGMIAAIEAGFFRREIADAAFAYQREVDARRKLIVGVNAFVEPDEKPLETLIVDDEAERSQIAALRQRRACADAGEIERSLSAVRRAAAAKENLVGPLLEAARARASVGQIMNAARASFRPLRGQDRVGRHLMLTMLSNREQSETGPMANVATPARVVLAKVGLDGHDRGVKIVARDFAMQGSM